ncbi:Cytochrome P450 71A2 [Zea mays]|uniref:Cytochrome P450 71A2 n=1 Tax=Zea mays TaxID=4577 RepID=A0A3L6E2Z0_MAIZE|nr:Cytochrome P450 71A2 [Zea mays]
MSAFVLAGAGAALLLGFLYIVKNRSSKSKLPPSPVSLPLVGHLHLIGRLPHRSLHELQLRYGGDGGLLLLHLGRRRTLVVSTTYGSRNISFSPYGDHWRRAKKIAVVHLLSQRRVDGFAPVRQAEAAALVARTRRAAEAGEAVQLKELLYGYTNSVVTRAAAGTAGTTAERLRQLLAHGATLVAGFQADDVLPSAAARVFRCATGLEKKIDDMNENWDRFLSEIVAEHKEKTRLGQGLGQGQDDDFLDVLLQLKEGGGLEGFELTDDDGIKAIAKDMIAAATDTTAVTLEWAMAELARNPRVMAKLQDEIARVAGGNFEQLTDLGDAELNKMVYLRAVVKEVFRLHPPVPLLLPRESMAAAGVQGGRYEIPATTALLVNAWAIGRDPAAWDAPEEFRPERFLAGSEARAVDVRGTDYQLLPFGTGRRICPGISVALAALELALASLLRHFDWELPSGTHSADMDMLEAPGLSTPPRVPLVLVPNWKPLA